ncbi:MAG: beta-ketoacyl synthase chain length factor [Cellvibrionaceae bacterium]|nr:beta-ketoacyl synthase chain length factor [Cellvibrionaceae bacterium]
MTVSTTVSTTTPILSCTIAAAASCGKGFDNWETLRVLLRGHLRQTAHNPNPKPTIIPANERRRAPLPVRLAVEVAAQASATAGIDPQDMRYVFVSGLGDTALTDYMCRVLASDNKQLSPTKFHNSVHNAPAGYWTISTASMQTANSIAGFRESLPLALLEAVVQCTQENTPVLLACYDAPVADPLQSLLKNREAFAAALVLLPGESGPGESRLQAQLLPQACDWPALETPQPDDFQALYQHNPAAKILPLLASLAAPQAQPQTLKLPLSPGSTLCLTLSPLTQAAATP